MGAQRTSSLEELQIKCTDWSIQDPLKLPAPFYYAMLYQVDPWETIELPARKSCSEFRKHCWKQENILLRHLCPVTCECDDPRGGQIFKKLERGCPKQLCRNSELYNDTITAANCSDEKPETL